jgi:hypothetical protein
MGPSQINELPRVDTGMGLPAPSANLGPLRLETLRQDPAGPSPTLDGAWWPWTLDLAEELPALIVELHGRGTRVSRVLYNPATWDNVPSRKLSADGRVIRVGWFRSMDPHVLTVTSSAGADRMDLLIVPPGTAGPAAERAMAAAIEIGNKRSASAVLEGAAQATPTA